MDKKIGLVLEGGGARGAYEVGVIDAIIESGRRIDVVVGTSIGAINGIFVAMDKIEDLRNLYMDVGLSDVFKGDEETLEKLARHEPDRGAFRYLLESIKERGFDISPLKRLLQHHIDEDLVRNSGVKFGLTTIAINGLDIQPKQLYVEDIPEGMIADYVVASASIPIFKPHYIGGYRMIDGAYYDNLPINMLEDFELDEIIAVRVYGIGRIPPVKPSLKDKITYVLPSEYLGNWISVENVKRNIELGYEDCKKVLGLC